MSFYDLQKENKQCSILIVDDEPKIVESLEKIFVREGLIVFTAPDAHVALSVLSNKNIDVLLTDLTMTSDMSGIDLLTKVKKDSPHIEVILMTAYGTMEIAAHAMKKGAYDAISKPVERAHIVQIVHNAIEKQSLIKENKGLKKQLKQKKHYTLIGTSQAWISMMKTVAQVADSQATVLIQGESGTGKELIARTIHEQSPRSAMPFIPINCAAIPESILEAELFGYEKGAFTGASHSREGRFEAAHCGTLFLDEIGEIPAHIQVKLLRVMQEGEIERLGSSGRSNQVNIRWIAATNRDLSHAVSQGIFREDLYYRLNVVSIDVPPLRERKEDILLLANYFLKLYSEKNGKSALKYDDEVLNILMNHQWPGNVRQLENTIEHAVVLSGDNTMLNKENFPTNIDVNDNAISSNNKLSISVGTSLYDMECQLIKETLRYTKGNKEHAAQILGIGTRTIYRRLNETDLEDIEKKSNAF